MTGEAFPFKEMQNKHGGSMLQMPREEGGRDRLQRVEGRTLPGPFQTRDAPESECTCLWPLLHNGPRGACAPASCTHLTAPIDSASFLLHTHTHSGIQGLVPHTPKHRICCTYAVKRPKTASQETVSLPPCMYPQNWLFFHTHAHVYVCTDMHTCGLCLIHSLKCLICCKGAHTRICAHTHSR